MFAVFKSQAALPNQLEEKLIHNARRLQHILRPLPPKERTGNLPQLRIDQLEQMLRSGRLPLTPLAKKHRNFARLSQEANPSWGESVVYMGKRDEARNLYINR